MAVLSPRASQTYDWSPFTHLDMLAHSPVVKREQLLKSPDQLTKAVET